MSIAVAFQTLTKQQALCKSVVENEYCTPECLPHPSKKNCRCISIATVDQTKFLMSF